MTTELSTQGVLLFAHGARDPRWALPFDAVADRVRRARPGWQVALAFLEFMAPDLRTAATLLADGGCRLVDVVPLFLGAGGHVRKDLPALLDEMRTAYPHVQWRLRPAIGEDASVIDAMALAAVGAVSTASIQGSDPGE